MQPAHMRQALDMRALACAAVLSSPHKTSPDFLGFFSIETARFCLLLSRF